MPARRLTMNIAQKHPSVLESLITEYFNEKLLEYINMGESLTTCRHHAKEDVNAFFGEDGLNFTENLI